LPGGIEISLAWIGREMLRRACFSRIFASPIRATVVTLCEAAIDAARRRVSRRLGVAKAGGETIR
jgi:hypothetical protein